LMLRLKKIGNHVRVCTDRYLSNFSPMDLVFSKLGLFQIH
jgi:hypothetical protein